MSEFLQSPSLILVCAIVFLLGIGLVIGNIIFKRIREEREVQNRIDGGNSFQPLQINQDENKGLLEKMGGHLTLPDAEEISKIRFQLAQAGYYEAGSVRVFFAARLLAIIIPQVLFLVYWRFGAPEMAPKNMVFFAILIGVIGVLGPNFYLRQRQIKRTDESREGFPDMMDLLIACIEAGMGMDAAFMRVGNELGRRYPALKINLDLMNLELRAGRSRHEALVNFSDRINLDEARALSTMLKQAEDMGSSLGQALRTFSDEMRTKRMLKAEEKAMALSAKLTVPLMVFIFPTLMVILLLPAGLRISEAL